MAPADLLGLGFPLAGVAMVALLYGWFRRLPALPPEPSGGSGHGPDGPRDPVQPCPWRMAGSGRRGRRSTGRRRRSSEPSRR